MTALITAVALFAAAVALGLAWALNIETRRRMTLEVDYQALQEARTTLQATFDRQRNSDKQVINSLSRENTDLWNELAIVQAQRDIRPPADPICEYLARHNPSHIADLINVFGRRVSNRLAILKQANLVDSDDDHLHWWVTTPLEAEATVTRIVPALTGATENDSEPPARVSTPHDSPQEPTGALRNGSIITWASEEALT